MITAADYKNNINDSLLNSLRLLHRKRVTDRRGNKLKRKRNKRIKSVQQVIKGNIMIGGPVGIDENILDQKSY